MLHLAESDIGLIGRTHLNKIASRWINPSLKHNYIGPELFSQIQTQKAQYVSILLESTKHIVHIESSPLPTKADLVLGLRFLNNLTYTTTDHALSIKINGRIIQANRTHD